MAKYCPQGRGVAAPILIIGPPVIDTLVTGMPPVSITIPQFDSKTATKRVRLLILCSKFVDEKVQMMT